MRTATRLAAALVLATSAAHAQDVKDNCADASERGQKLVDARRLLEARNAFISCAQESCPAAVRSDCQAQLDAVKKNIPTIVVRAKDKSGSDVAQGAISLDGTKVGVLDGQDIQLDPGTHDVQIDLPDGRSFHRQVILAAGERSRQIVFDERAPAATAPVAEKAPAKRWTVVRSIGFVSTIVGGVAVTGGLITELVAVSAENNATTLRSRSANCPTLSPQPPDGPYNYDASCQDAISYHSQALTDQTLAFALLIGGGVALVGGIVLFVVGGNKPASSVALTPLVGPGFGGVGLGGTF
jgi:hypothetical protein